MVFDNDNKKENNTDRRNRVTNPTPFSGLGKLPPQAIDVEEAVLGALMLEKDAIGEVIGILEPEVFYVDKHQRIYREIQKLYIKSDKIDILTVTAALRYAGDLEMIGGAYYITELTNRVASAANIETHSRIIYQKFLQREMIRISTETIHAAYEDTTDVFDMIDKNQSDITNMMSSVHGATISDVSDLVGEEVMKLYEPKIEGLVGVGSGFTELDNLTNGWVQPNLIIIAARPAMGKTAFMLNCARNASVDFGKPGIIFSLEMSKQQLVQRLIAAETEILLDNIIKRNLTDEDIQQLEIATKTLQIEQKLFIDDTAGITILELRSKVKRAKQKWGIEWFMVDYLQLMHGTRDKKFNREQEIASISAGLKDLCKTLNIPGIALSQLSRAVESRPGGSKRPQLSDLRESGAIEQDADQVLFLYRPEYYGLEVDEDNMPTKGIGEVILAKNRHGACNHVKLKFNGAIQKFSNLEIDPNWEPNFTPPSNFIIRPSRMDDMDDDQPF